MKRLRTRLLILVLLAVLPALGAIVYSGVRAQHRAYAKARDEARTIDALVAASFRRNAQEARILVTTLAQVPAVLPGSRGECGGIPRWAISGSSTVTVTVPAVRFRITTGFTWATVPITGTR